MIRSIAAALAAFALLSFGVRAEDAKPAEAPKADAAKKAEKKADKKAEKKTDEKKAADKK